MLLSALSGNSQRISVWLTHIAWCAHTDRPKGLLNHSYIHGSCGSISTQYAVRPIDGNDIPLLPAKQVVDGHAQGLGFGVHQRVLDSTERLGAQSIRGGSRGSRKGGIEALMVVYCLADQSVSVPLDDGREPGGPEGLVEFAPADDPVIGDELEKVIVTPSGIAGQRFDPLDSHRPGSSLRAGSLSTASRSPFLSIQPPVRAGPSERYYWASSSAPQDALTALA